MQSHTVHIVPSTRKTAEYQCMTIWIWWVLFTAYTHQYHAEWYTRRYFRMLFRWFFYCCCRLDAIPLRKGDDLNSIFFLIHSFPLHFFCFLHFVTCLLILSIDGFFARVCPHFECKWNERSCSPFSPTFISHQTHAHTHAHCTAFHSWKVFIIEGIFFRWLPSSAIKWNNIKWLRDKKMAHEDR